MSDQSQLSITITSARDAAEDDVRPVLIEAGVLLQLIRQASGKPGVVLEEPLPGIIYQPPIGGIVIVGNVIRYGPRPGSPRNALNLN